MNEIGGSMFFLAWLVGVGSWFFVILESVGWLAMWPWVFRLGPKVVSEDTTSAPPSGLSFPHVGETADAKYKVLAGNSCVFRRKYRYMALRWNTPFDIRGTVTWNAGVLTTTGRLPVGVIVFFAAWLVGWTVGTGFATLHDVTAVPFLLIGWVFIAAMVGSSWFIERPRFRKYAAEVLEALSTPRQQGVA